MLQTRDCGKLQSGRARSRWWQADPSAAGGSRERDPTQHSPPALCRTLQRAAGQALAGHCMREQGAARREHSAPAQRRRIAARHALRLLATPTAAQCLAHPADPVEATRGCQPINFLPFLEQVVLHDLASADARDIPRSSCFESRAPTALAFLLLNLPSLTGYTASGGAAQAKVRVGAGVGGGGWGVCVGCGGGGSCPPLPACQSAHRGRTSVPGLQI